MDYSQVLVTLEDTPQPLTYDELGNVTTAEIEDQAYEVVDDVSDPTAEEEKTQYDFDYSTEREPRQPLDYSTIRSDTEIDVADYEPNYEERKDIRNKPSTVGYKKMKDISPTKPINFKEEDAKIERTSLKSIQSYKDIPDDVDPIDVLMSQEPDFMANMYNLYIVEVPADKKESAFAAKSGIPLGTYIGPETNTGRDYLSTIMTDFYSLLGMRIDGIEIPQRQYQTADIKVAGQVVKKVVGKVNQTNKGSFTVDLDQSMFILDAFHRLNGDWWAKERAAYEALDDKTLKGDTPAAGQKISGKQFVLNFGNLPFHSDIDDMGGKKRIIDIIVEYDAAYQIYSRANDKSNEDDTPDPLSFDMKPKLQDKRYLNGTSGRVQRYILHDVRFLGRSSGIAFNNSGADVLKATIPFTFRRVVKVSDTGYCY